MGEWHPSYYELIERVACPVCSVAPGLWCEDPEIPDGEQDIHVERILLGSWKRTQ